LNVNNVKGQVEEEMIDVLGGSSEFLGNPFRLFLPPQKACLICSPAFGFVCSRSIFIFSFSYCTFSCDQCTVGFVCNTCPILISTTTTTTTTTTTAPCTGIGLGCITNSQCCSNLCILGICLCLINGQPCVLNTECCSGNCAALLCSP